MMPAGMKRPSEACGMMKPAGKKRPSADLSDFFKRLKGAVPDEKNTLSLDGLNKNTLAKLQVLGPQGVADVRFLLRKEYGRLYDELNITEEFAAIVVGTAGIGKSAFRFYVMRRWMRGEMRGEMRNRFPKAIFNLGNDFYELDRNGSVRELVDVGSLGKYDDRALALFDPCPLVSGLGKNLHFRYMLVTTSPSPLSGQESKVGTLTELSKSRHAPVLVMQGWTEEEVLSVHPHADKVVLEAFGHVPSWCMYPSVDDISLQKKLFDNFGHRKLEALYGFIRKQLTHGEPIQDADLPYRVLKIEDSKRGWGATGFISDHVAGLFCKEAQKVAHGKTADFVQMMNNPFGMQALGPLFEEWAFTSMARGARCVLKGAPPPLGVFKRAGTFERDDVGTKAKASKKIKPGTLYRAPVGYGTIDMHGVVESANGKEKQLLLLQGTVGRQHRPGQWTHVQHIVEAARTAQVTRMTLVYLVPKGKAFVVPKCPALKGKNLEIVRGSLRKDMGVPVKAWKALR